MMTPTSWPNGRAWRWRRRGAPQPRARDLERPASLGVDREEEQLLELKNVRQGRTKDFRHDGENQHLGQVAEVTPGEDFGFILTKEGGLLYFHRNSVLTGDFDALEQGQQVYYVEAAGDTGP